MTGTGGCLTSALSGPRETRPARRECKISRHASGAPPTTFHGPLQRIVRPQSTRRNTIPRNADLKEIPNAAAKIPLAIPTLAMPSIPESRSSHPRSNTIARTARSEIGIAQRASRANVVRSCTPQSRHSCVGARRRQAIFRT